MVERAAGAPSAPAVPHPPSQFHWPATVNTPSLRPLVAGSRQTAVLSRLSEEVKPLRARQSTMEDAPQRRTQIDVQRESLPQLRKSASLSSLEDTSGERTVSLAPDLTQVDRTQRPPDPIVAIVDPPRLEATPSEKTRSLEPWIANIATNEDLLTSDPVQETVISKTLRAAETVSPAQPKIPPSFEKQAPALGEIQSVDRVRVPAIRSGTLEPNPIALVSARTPAGDSEPGLEVKIGSVEIVFDPPPATAHPARSYPAGFAEFADLRRYAAGPWSHRS
jgi:hypothetical protein